MKIYSLLIAGLIALSFTSCKKCATCTYTENGENLTDEVCGSGRLYKDGVNQHEKSGWTCN